MEFTIWDLRLTRAKESGLRTGRAGEAPPFHEPQKMLNGALTRAQDD
jgi:hypothetical protein